MPFLSWGGLRFLGGPRWPFCSAASAARIFLVFLGHPPSVCSLLPSILRLLLVFDALV